MDLSTFYALMSVTCFTLVGLWWTAIEKHDEWRTDPRLRRLAGGTYLSFLLPGVMSMMSQVNPDNPLMWRISFGVTSIVGLVSSIQLVAVEFARPRRSVPAVPLARSGALRGHRRARHRPGTGRAVRRGARCRWPPSC